MQKAAGTQAGDNWRHVSYGFLMDATLGSSVGTHLVDLNLSAIELKLEVWELSSPDGI